MKSVKGPTNPHWQRPVEIVECEDEFIIKVELPGIRQGQVRVKLDGSIISISGKPEPEGNGQTFQRVETAKWNFYSKLHHPRVDHEGQGHGELHKRIAKSPSSKRSSRKDKIDRRCF